MARYKVSVSDPHKTKSTWDSKTPLPEVGQEVGQFLTELPSFLCMDYDGVYEPVTFTVSSFPFVSESYHIRFSHHRMGVECQLYMKSGLKAWKRVTTWPLHHATHTLRLAQAQVAAAFRR